MITNGELVNPPEHLDPPNIFGDLLSGAEVRAGSGNTSKFTFDDVMLASRRIDAAGILAMFEQWNSEDRGGKYRGGRKAHLDNRAIMIAAMLLITEGTPIWMTEMSNIFWYRLTPDARRAIGIEHIRTTGVDGTDGTDGRNWYDRTDGRLHHILELMDAWPVPNRKKSMDREQRERILAERDPGTARIKRERLNRFTNAMLEMTFRAQPEHMQREWTGGLSVDQTALRAPSQLSRWPRDKKTKLEAPEYDSKTGEEIRKLVLEIDADSYPIKKSSSPRDRDLVEDGADTIAVSPGDPFSVSVAGKSSSAKRTKRPLPRNQYEWDYMLNIVMSVRDPLNPTKHPPLAMAASMSTPNKAIGEVTVAAVRSVIERGHEVTRLASDLATPATSASRFQAPMREMGVPLVRQYKRTQLGVNGGVAGSVQVEGAHYCPVTPAEMLNASVDLDNKEISFTDYHKLIVERQHYRLRPKEARDERGFVPMVCPA